MSGAVDRVRGFLVELKRRKVYRATAVYAVVAIGGLEVLDLLVPATSLPEWADEVLVALAIVGFPLVLVLGWMFDITPDGVRRTDDLAAAGAQGSSVPEAAPEARTRSSGGPAAIAPEEEASTRAGRHLSPVAGDDVLEPTVVAVLPFDNLSGVSDAEPFVTGLHDDLLTELSRMSALTVISRTSVRGYRDSPKTIREIARELGAGTIIEGGVQKAGDRVRLNVQLIDARRDVHLWAERYDRDLTAENIFDLQSELSSRIMRELHAQITAGERDDSPRLPTGDLAAYRQFAIGRGHFVDRSEEALHAALQHFEHAVELDPEYALAWAGLGNALIMLVEYGHEEAADLLKRGEAAAMRALEIDPRLAEAYAALGNLYATSGSWGWRDGPKALEAQQRAIALRPSYAGAHQWSCWVSLLIGEPAAAVESGLRATRLDPLDPEARTNLAVAYLGTGDGDRALEVARTVLDRHPDFDYAIWAEGLTLMELERYDDAVSAFARLTDRWSRAWPETGRGLRAGLAGDLSTLAESESKQRNGSAAFHVALLAAAGGRTEKALDAFDDAAQWPWDEVLCARYYTGEPIASLRAEAGFHRIMVRLDEAWGVSGAGTA